LGWVVSAPLGLHAAVSSAQRASTPPRQSPLPSGSAALFPAAAHARTPPLPAQAVSLCRQSKGAPPSPARPLTCAHSCRRMLPAPPATTLAGGPAVLYALHPAPCACACAAVACVDCIPRPRTRALCALAAPAPMHATASLGGGSVGMP